MVSPFKPQRGYSHATQTTQLKQLNLTLRIRGDAIFQLSQEGPTIKRATLPAESAAGVVSAGSADSTRRHGFKKCGVVHH